jgi:heterodisulfide reductase subunit C
MAFAADILPHRIVRLAQLGANARLFGASAPWLCTGCKACQARCPNGIDVSRVNDALKTLAARSRIRPADGRVAAFHSSFLTSVKWLGRSYEVGMLGLYKVKSGTYLADLGLGLAMFRRGKLRLLPERIHRLREVAALFRHAAAGPEGGRE